MQVLNRASGKRAVNKFLPTSVFQFIKLSNNSSLSKKAEMLNQKAKYQMYTSNREMVIFWAKGKSLIWTKEFVRTHLLYHNENCHYQSHFYYTSVVPKDPHVQFSTWISKHHRPNYTCSFREPQWKSQWLHACTTGIPPLFCSSDDGDNRVIRQMALLQQKVLIGDKGNTRVAICRQQMEMEEKEIIKLCIKTELA